MELHRFLTKPSVAVAALCLTAPLWAQSAGGPELPDGLSTEDWAEIQSLMEARIYQAEETADGFKAFNQFQGWWTQFDGQGFLVQPRDGQWTWGLELQSYGFADHVQVVTDGAEARAEGNRVTYGWGTNLEEWYINDTRGLEHGYTLASRPAGGEGRLTFDLAVRGPLQAKLQESGTGLTFLDGEGFDSLSYSGLHVFDANGVTQEAHFALSEGSIQIIVDESEATYPLTVDPLTQRHLLKAFNSDVDDHFGFSVAASGDRVAVGAPGEDTDVTGVNNLAANENAQDSGAVYVFQHTSNQWRIIAYLKASNTGAGDRFGHSLAMERNRIVVGAPGEDSGAVQVNGNGNDNSVPDSGAAYVFEYNSTQSAWQQKAYLKGRVADSMDGFGSAVALEDYLIAVGSPGEDGSGTGLSFDWTSNAAQDSGAVTTYSMLTNSWIMDRYIKASNTDAGDRFGSSVAIALPHLYVGAPGEGSATSLPGGSQADNSLVDAGAVYVYQRSGAQWIVYGYIKPQNPDSGDLFGSAVSATILDIVVGAPGESSDGVGVNGVGTNSLAPDSGAAYAYRHIPGNFVEVAYLKASDVNPGAEFGRSLAISGDRILVGAHGESRGNGSPNDNFHTGAGYLFAWAGGGWTQGPYLKPNSPDRLDEFGSSVALFEGIAILGAPGDDSGSRGVFPDDTDNSMSESGAGFIYELDNPFEYYCQPSVPNSTGFGGAILASGSARVGDNRFYLGAAQIPQYSFGYFLGSQSQDYVPGAMGSQGTMCVGGMSVVARKVVTIGQAPDYGFFAAWIDLSQIPLSSGPVQVAAGETWYFQCWYRDMNPGPTSNFTNALGVTFE